MDVPEGCHVNFPLVNLPAERHVAVRPKAANRFEGCQWIKSIHDFARRPRGDLPARVGARRLPVCPKAAVGLNPRAILPEGSEGIKSARVGA